MRPTTAKLRMQVFNICQHMIEGARVLDVFAGSGAVGFEALSRGATHCTFVEKDRSAVMMLHKNARELNAEESSTILGIDALSAIKKIHTLPPFSIVYIDPPYDLVGTPYFSELLSVIDHELPMEPGGYLFIETREKSTLPQLISFSLVSRRKSGQSELWQFTPLK